MNREKIVNHLRELAKKTPSPFDPPKITPNPYAQIPEIPDNAQWISALYHLILDRKNGDPEGHKHWMGRVDKDLTRQQIEEYFRQVAYQELQKGNPEGKKFEDFLNKDDKGRVIIVQPEGAEDIFLITALFESVKKSYPQWALYVSTKREFKEIIDGNPHVDGWIEYSPIMDNILFLEGNNSHNGYFDVAYLPYLSTQRNPTHTHNGVDVVALPIK